MSKVTFYLLSADTPVEGLSAVEALACDLAVLRWRTGIPVLLFCQNKQQAVRLDDALWHYPFDTFLPHNLAGEGPEGGAPVELIWSACLANTKERQLLINLSQNVIDFSTDFHEVIDFVPYEENLKTLARQRYKTYRQLNFQLETRSDKEKLF